ncbi:unnamed protein product, partial [Meganyctiphanes norvegica]
KAYTGNIIKLVLEKITEYNVSGATFKFSSKYKVKLLIWICHHLTYKFEKTQTNSENHIDKRIDVINHKTECFIHFNNTYEKISAENSAIGVMILSLHETLKNSLHRKMITVVVQDVIFHVPCLHSKAEIVKTILEELVENNSYEEYIPFFHNTEKFLQKRIKNYTDIYLFENKMCCKTNFARILEKEIQFQVNNMKQKVRDTQVKGKRNLQMWIRDFYKGIDLEMITFQDLSPVFKYEIDITSFQIKILKKMTRIQNDLMKLYENINADQFCNQYQCVYEKITKQCIGCTVQCPLCGCLCSLSNPNHENKHQAIIHYPLCVKGNLGNDKTLLIKNCNSKDCASIPLNDASAENMEYPQENYAWNIPKDESVQLSLYWKWFVSNFQNRISKQYGIEISHIPESWQIISKQDAVQSLNS